jgi:hypothetical protein
MGWWSRVFPGWGPVAPIGLVAMVVGTIFASGASVWGQIGGGQPGVPSIDWSQPTAPVQGEGASTSPVLSAPGAATEKPSSTGPMPGLGPILPGSPPTGTRGPVPAPGGVQEVQPSEYWLPSKSGALQPVINIPFEVFEKIYTQIQSGGQPPAYTITALRIAGSAGGNRAELEFSIRAYIQGGGWVAVPLGMDSGAVLAESQHYEGPGRYFLAFDVKQGYVWWVRSESEGTHELRFVIYVPVARSDQGAQLRLLTPQAAVAEASLEITEGPVVFELGEGLQVRATEVGEKSSKIELIGLGGQLGRGGQLSIAWRPVSAALTGRETLQTELSAKVTARVFSDHVLTSAELNFRAFGGVLREAEICLPPKAILLLPEEETAYKVEGLGSSTEGSEGFLVVRIRFPEPLKTGGVVNLSWRQDLAEGEEVDLGFRPGTGVVRNFGALIVVSSTPRVCEWSLAGDIRRVEASSLSDLVRKSEEILGAFEYYSGGYKLRMRWLPQRSYLTASPEYDLTIHPDYIRLVGRFRLFVRGQGITNLELLTDGWQIEQIEPESLLAVEIPVLQESPIFPLRLSQPILGSSEVVVTARRKLQLSEGKLKIPLLTAKADLIGSGSLTVRSEQNVEIVFDPSESIGIFRHEQEGIGPALGGFPIRGYFQIEPARESCPVFVVDCFVHRQEITLASEATVLLRSGSGSLEQRIFYEIAYQPLETLTLAIPESIARSNGLELLLDGVAIGAIRSLSHGDGEGKEEVSIRRIILPEPRLGLMELTIRASFPVPFLPPRASASVKVPLVVPREGAWKSNRVRLLVEEGIRVQPRTGIWHGAVDSFGWLEGPEILLYTEGGTTELPLALHRPGGQRIFVERAWIQSFLGSRVRQDRVVLRLWTGEPDIEIRLPPGVDPDEIWVTVAVGSPENVQKIRRELTPGGSLQVFLPQHSQAEPIFLDLTYRLPAELRQGQPLQFAFAEVEGGVWIQRVYWQLVLPSRWHLLVGPSDWLGEYRLDFVGGVFVRRPILQEDELAEWVGAPQIHAVPQGAEVYLFSRCDSVVPVRVVLIQRPTAVFATSAVILIAGLAVIYLPVLRHPAMLLLVAVMVGAGSAVDPVSTVLLGQAGLLGFILVGLAAVLRRKFQQPARVSQEVLAVGSTEAELAPTGPRLSPVSSTLERSALPASSSIRDLRIS